MAGVIWAGSIWTVFLLVYASLSARSRLGGPGLRVSREHIAIVLVLLGTHSTVGSSTAEEVLRDPLVLERIVRGALAGLGLLVVLPMIFRRHRSRIAERKYTGLVALSAYWGIATLSTLYSAAPVVTIGKVLELTAGMAIVWAIAVQPDARARFRASIKFVVFLEAALLGAAVLGFFLLPSTFAKVIARPGFILEATMFAPFRHSNALSASGGLVAAYSLAALFGAQSRRARAGWVSLFLLGTFAVVLASGRQGVVIWLAAIMLLLWLERRRLFVFFLAPAAALIIGSYGDVIWSALVRNRPANIATLTGRIGYWEAAFNSWTLHPITGYGYGAGGRFVALASVGDNVTGNLHSGYAEALVGLGIIGLIPLGVAIWHMTRWSFVRLVRRRDLSLAIVSVPLLLHTSVSKGFAAWLTADFLLFAFLVTLAGLERGDQRLDRSQGSKGRSILSSSH